MPGLPHIIADRYGTPNAALEDLRSVLSTEEAYTCLFEDERILFHNWAFRNAADYVDSICIDWVGAFYDWNEGLE